MTSSEQPMTDSLYDRPIEAYFSCVYEELGFGDVEQINAQQALATAVVLRRSLEEFEDELRNLVLLARQDGDYSWQDVADAFGMASRQAAQQRYGLL